MPSATISGVHPDHVLLTRASGGATASATPGPTGTTPAQIKQAYGFNQINFGSTPGDGHGTTIAIVDAYDDPNIASDLIQFDAKFGLPNPTFTKVNQTGGTAPPAPDAGWASEIALDVEWSHAIAPGANILLVEASDNSYTNLFAAVSYAAKQSGVVAVSMSFAGGEFTGETSYDSSTFKTPAGHTGVTFIASSGDTGAPTSYPSASPNVLSVGGTTLNLNSAGAILSETGWSGSGGGISTMESQPSYQKGVVTQSNTFRTNPDVSYDADPNTGFPVYDSYNNGTSAPWSQFGGTSDAAPQWAGLIAIADQGRIQAGLAPLDGPSQTLPALYALPAADFHDVTSGNSSGSPTEKSGPGYDLVTGRGTPIANLVVAGLVGQSSTTPAATHFGVTSTASTAGVAATVTVTALDANGNTVAGYMGTVHFTSSDASAILPGNATLTGGTGTFSVTLKTVGSQTITATDTASATITGTATVTVTAAATHFSVTTTVSTAGTAATVTVTALDANGIKFTGYMGTVHFTSSDGSALLPVNSTLTNGVGTFSVTLKTAGSQTITATDTAKSSLTGTATVTINPAAPSKLAIGQQPTSTTVGAILAPAVTVRVLDAYGNLVSSDNTDKVTLTLGNSGGATLGGTTTVTVSGGVATFSTLTIGTAGNGYTLTASSGTLTSATTPSFNITAAATGGGSVIESFENSGNWYVVGGRLTAYRSTAAAHDGKYGLDMYNGNDWIYRNDAASQVQAGDTLSVWLQFSNSADGRAYFGFGSTAYGTLSLVAAPNSGQLILQENLGYGYQDLASVNQTYQANHWYRLEVDWSTTGAIIGTLFDSNGTTQLRSVSAVTTDITSGGIAFRSTGSDKFWDTVTDTRGVNSFALKVTSPVYPITSSGGGSGIFGGWSGGMGSWGFSTPSWSAATATDYYSSYASAGSTSSYSFTAGSTSPSPFSDPWGFGFGSRG